MFPGHWKVRWQCMALKISEREIRYLYGSFLTIWLFIRSRPGAFLVGNVCMICNISPRLVCLAGRAIGRADSNERLIIFKWVFSVWINIMWLKNARKVVGKDIGIFGIGDGP